MITFFFAAKIFIDGLRWLNIVPQNDPRDSDEESGRG